MPIPEVPQLAENLTYPASTFAAATLHSVAMTASRCAVAVISKVFKTMYLILIDGTVCSPVCSHATAAHSASVAQPSTRAKCGTDINTNINTWYGWQRLAVSPAKDVRALASH